jgi:DNA-binding response OmpR family regulator
MARRSYGRALVGLGYAVDGVENGERAWQALRNGSYALLITENRLPKLSGWQLVQRLRGEGMGLPVILASGRIDLLEGEGSELCDIAVVLEKPFELPDLVDAVQYALHSDHGWRNGTRRYVATLADASSNWMKP